MAEKGSNNETFKITGWPLVRQSINRIREYGRAEGILAPLPVSQGDGLAGLAGAAQQAAKEDDAAKSRLAGDKVNLPTNDISSIHEAIPFLPVPAAALCFVFNIVFPGLGTLMSGVFGMCIGQPRIQIKEGRAFFALIVNACVAGAQFMTITFTLVGWFWSIAWGGLMVIHSMQYRKALIDRRKEAMATAALEALTKDSILHRKDVKKIMR